MKHNILETRSILVLGIVAILLSGIVILGSRLPIKLVDFTVNWSAGSLLLEGNNPYNPVQIVSREQAAGLNIQNPEMMQYWYPPWALAVSIIFAAVSYQISQIIWLLLTIGIVCFCATTLWKLYQGSQKSIWFAWLIALTFTPAMYALVFGQFNPLVLLGITGFLIFVRHQTSKDDLIAGLFLGLCAIKPALLYLLWPALLLWSLYERRFRILAGLALAIIVGSLISMIFRPVILLDYLQFFKIASVTNWKVPTLGFWLRDLFEAQNAIWQYIPVGLGLIWLLIHWILHRKDWDWLQQISWISFMSLITTAFAWSHDQIILLPAVIEAAVLIHSQVKSQPLRIGLLLIWLAFVAFLFASHLTHDDSWFVWQAPVLLLVYALIKYYTSMHTEVSSPELLKG